jgi:hypothetical protein
MWNDSNLRWPPEKYICQIKMHLSRSKTTSKNKMSVKKKYVTVLLISHTYYTKQVRFYLPLPFIVTVSIFIASAFIFLTLLIFPTSSLPFHNISSCIALDIQHFLKPFTVTFGKMHCLAVMIHDLCFLVYKLTWIHEDSPFSPHVVLMGLRI